MTSDSGAGRRWARLLTDEDAEILAAGGHGGTVGYGSRPAVLVIDVNRNFLGDRREPISKSVQRFPFSCGERGWDALPHIARLLDAARGARARVFYCTGRWTPWDLGVADGLNTRFNEIARGDNSGAEIVPEIRPQKGDFVLEKHYPSMLFGTPLVSYLVQEGIDTLLITGTSTSGCVRATTVDAYSHNFRAIVVEECVFDRVQLCHEMALLDLDTKYADVVSVDSAVSYLRKLDHQEAA